MTVHISPLPDSATPPDPEGGLGALATDRGNLPLDSVDIKASITGLAAGIELTQGFRNPFDVPLEATYIFPLPDRAAVTALRMEAADRVVEGVLKEREQARRDYDAAIAAGRRAAIAEEDRPDVFTMRVGNILPGEHVTIRLTLNQPLPYEDDQATFRFPLVVAPRYIPGTPLDEPPAGDGVASDTDAVPDASRISPPVLLPGFPNPVRLSISVDVDPAGLPLTEIRSALHVVAEESEGGRTAIRLRPGERLDRDFLLRLSYTPQETASLTLVPDDDSDEGTFTLTVLSTGRHRPRPRDVVLVLDRSGSMHGWKMVAARRAAARIVDTLRSADNFAVLAFDNVVEHPPNLGPGLLPGTDRNRFRAVEFLAGLEARGGTEVIGPLTNACDLLRDSESDRVLILITDGQIANEDQILAHLGPRLRGIRVHTVGIDQAVNAGFLQRLAHAGQGHCELVESERRLDEAMEHIHHRVGAPLVTDLRLVPDGLSVIPDTVTPSRLGALYPGVPLVISGRFQGPPRGSLTVHGVTPEGAAWQQRSTGAVSTDSAVASLWARAHLRDLEDRYLVSGTADIERQIVDTSLRFGVLCRFTAFVAVDGRVVAEGGAPTRWSSRSNSRQAGPPPPPRWPRTAPRCRPGPPPTRRRPAGRTRWRSTRRIRRPSSRSAGQRLPARQDTIEARQARSQPRPAPTRRPHQHARARRDTRAAGGLPAAADLGPQRRPGPPGRPADLLGDSRPAPRSRRHRRRRPVGIAHRPAGRPHPARRLRPPTTLEPNHHRPDRLHRPEAPLQAPLLETHPLGSVVKVAAGWSVDADHVAALRQAHPSAARRRRALVSTASGGDTGPPSVPLQDRQVLPRRRHVDRPADMAMTL
ncbi:VIT domain-containing protein [Actinomadura keratinilytica]|uniref:VIT domain-containing protein n=1 Tax=Actinomadura keratinilytica TaxID=547461 RepID=UPI00361C6575